MSETTAPAPATAVNDGALLTVTNGFTNNGAIELTDVVSSYGATLTVTSGTLSNPLGSTITALPGAGGGRTLNAQLDNQGTLTVSGGQGLAIARASSAHTNGGTIDLTGGNLTLTQSGTTPSITNTGTVAIMSAAAAATTRIRQRTTRTAMGR